MLRQVIEAYELLDCATINAACIARYLRQQGLEDLSVKPCRERDGRTDFLRIYIPGSNGKSRGGSAPTLGIIGRLGGVGARPHRLGLVSDADGAITAVACALKLATMTRSGDPLLGDVIITTHVCPRAPTVAHEPVPFMGSPVKMATMNAFEVDSEMEAILSVDTTKGNELANFRGFAITPTVKEGYILRVDPVLLRIMAWATGQPPRVIAITTQDITPYANGLFHLNSIMQPAVATNAPVVGVAITATSLVPGCSTGSSREIDIESAARYCIEVAKAFTSGQCSFYDAQEFHLLVQRYGTMNHLQHPGKGEDT